MRHLLLAVICSVLFPVMGSQSAGAEGGGAAPSPCSDPGCDEFDFWIGDWDLTWSDGGVGTNIVTRGYGGCVVQEKFAAPGIGFHGMSVSVYLPTEQVWKQTWVDDAGGYLDFVGTFSDGRMRLSRTTEVQGVAIDQRMTFRDIRENSFDWDWEVSRDGGDTWEMRWQIHYERRR